MRRMLTPLAVSARFLESHRVLCSYVPCLSAKACLHVARVSRVLQQAGGHAMLIGVGGSGKQSLAKLAVYMAELTPMSIVISKSYNLNDFKTDLQVRIAS